VPRACGARGLDGGGNLFRRAISGSSMFRAGIRSLLADAEAGCFDMVLSEALDRISRDQEHVAAVFNPLRFAGVSIVTLSEGEINELHVGLKGTMTPCSSRTSP